ncbi:UBP-type zinc finger domain-containing protein [Streptomyces sp. NPDC051286]|uniref:UBP-type zinc finger domain-containing protein n=1 Tax=Streptomyces sp. NPDC051286 TaxID=3365647 RepID=UPI00378CF947
MSASPVGRTARCGTCGKTTPQGREECLRLGSSWVHLLLRLTCGHAGCCASSLMRHARGHAATTGHPIVQSFEPGEDWRWCFVHEAMV